MDAYTIDGNNILEVYNSVSEIKKDIITNANIFQFSNFDTVRDRFEQRVQNA